MPALTALGELVEREGVEVTQSYCERDEDRGGAFFPDGHMASKGPTIELTRPRSEQGPHTLQWSPTSAQRREVLFTLAHEYGHYLSWMADEARYEAFFEAYSRFKYIQQARRLGMPTAELLSAEDGRLVEEEEQRAWDLGRGHVPLELREAYVEYRLARVDRYRQGMLACSRLVRSCGAQEDGDRKSSGGIRK